MGVFVELFVGMGKIALGLTTFSIWAWLYVTVLLLVLGPVFVHVAPRVIDPSARLLATDPVRVTIWLPLSLLALFFGTIALVITIFASPLAPLLAISLGMVGYLAVALLVGQQLALRVAGVAVPHWLGAAIGIVLLRLVRLVPIIGAPAHSLMAWVGFAAATCVAVRMGRQWYKRRLPDEVQFRGETLVEWYPDGDPADGKPAFGTGRPVLDNVRGDERDDRPRRSGEGDAAT